MVIIKSINDLETLLTNKNLKQEFVSLEVTDLNKEEIQHWQNKLNSFQNECGCSEGTKFMVCCTIFYIALFFLLPTMFHTTVLIKIFLGIGIAFISAVIGKIYGLRSAKINHKRFIKQLIIRLGNISSKTK